MSGARAPRGLSAAEAEAWARLAQSVKALPGKTAPAVPSRGEVTAPTPNRSASRAALKPVKPQATPKPAAMTPVDRTFDSHWERRLKAGALQPELTLDLHGLGLDAAYHRLLGGMDQARAMGVRVVLVIAGKERPVDPADRGTRRGAIRAKMLDWLAASGHASDIAAIRKAHQRHGGEGALYVILRKPR